MNFVSIRSKLLKQVSRILLGSFVLLIGAVAILQIVTSKASLEQSASYIRTALEAKANLLVANNSQALKGMAEDYAFTAVRELVASTVAKDDDIVYGIYMDIDLQPWVHANYSNPSGQVEPGTELNDDVSNWAAELETAQFKELTLNNEQIYEYAAPVSSDGEILGIIRYGVSTAQMKTSLEQAEHSASQAAWSTGAVLVFISLAAIILGVMFTRRMAQNITQPLDALKRSAEIIADGDYNSEVNVKSDDEIGVLANNFDSMRSTIKKKIDDLAKLNEQGEQLATTREKDCAINLVLEGLQSHFQASLCWAIGVEEPTNATITHELTLHTSSFQPTQAFVEWLIQQVKSTNDVIQLNDHELKDQFELAADHSLVILPVKDEDRLTRLLIIIADNNIHEVDQGDLEYCRTLVRSLSISINNIQMQEVIEEQNRTLEHKVEERTAELQVKTNDILSMMQNMHQGLLTIVEGGQVHQEYAAYCESIFETSDIAGRSAMDLLFSSATLGSNTLDQISTALDALLGEDEMMWDFNSHLLITEYVVQFGEDREKILELDWDPIVFDDVIVKVMVTIRDVTELKALQLEADKQKKELEIIGHILSLPEEDFSDFISSSINFIDECRQIISKTAHKDIDVIATLFRNMHTVKGNARTYGFGYITDSVHDVETTYDQLRKDESFGWEPNTLLKELKVVEDDLLLYKNVATEQLGRGDQVTSNIQLDKTEIEKLISAHSKFSTAGLPEEVSAYIEQVNQLLQCSQVSSLEHALNPVVKSIQSLAQELDKPEPEVLFECDGIRIPNDHKKVLQDIFTHLFRNSLDHGFESAEQRTLMGKPAHGKILVSSQVQECQLQINVSDDGKGLPLGKLKQKGISQGLFEAESVPDAQSIANLIFHSGLSTAQQVSTISGRGVGMEAVQQFIQQLGGELAIKLHDSDSDRDGYAPFSLVISLPESFFIALN